MGSTANAWVRMMLAALIVLLAVVAGMLMMSETVQETLELGAEGGVIVLNDPLRPIRDRERVLLFALDGVGDDTLRDLVARGRMPALAALLGGAGDGDIYPNAYAVPDALSIIPSTTMAAWTSIFTGHAVAATGVSGNEWYSREEQKFYAPGPVSVPETDHLLQSYTEGLLDGQIRVPTLFERADVRTHVALLPIRRGADVQTVPTASDVASAFGRTAAGVVDDDPVDRELYRTLEETTVEQLLDAFETYGIPDLQVVYFPGIDLYAHVAEPPRPELERYLEEITDPAIGRIVDAYRTAGLLERTFVVFTSDHGHTPVLKDDAHALGADDENGPPALLEYAGFRPRATELDPDADDYQAVVAYQGAIAYVYLADRSTCEQPGTTCSWMLPPRFDADVLHVVRAFDAANQTGTGLPALYRTLDLILAREPTLVGEDALPFRVWNGDELISVGDYLAATPRPDLPDFEARLLALATGPYGHRAGDVLLLAKSGMNRPIDERYYFSKRYTSWHGSPEWQDSRIPILVASAGHSGNELQQRVRGVLSEPPSQLDVTPIVLRLLDLE
jgi:hypothetical protein